jgi:hypothetical protein
LIPRRPRKRLDRAFSFDEAIRFEEAFAWGISYVCERK